MFKTVVNIQFNTMECTSMDKTFSMDIVQAGSQSEHLEIADAMSFKGPDNMTFIHIIFDAQFFGGAVI